MYNSFEKLEVWKRACTIAVSIYDTFTNCRDYSLKDQMSRAAVSIASNIAEGAERDSPKEYIRFLHIAKGSAAELRTQIYISCRIGIITIDKQKELTEELKVISKMLQSLIKSIKPKT